MYKRIFYPDNIPATTPERFGLGYESVYFHNADGLRLHGWFIPAATVTNPKDAKGTVIHLHNYAGNISSNWHFAGWLPDQGYNVFTFDYRGFGKSFGGTPEPKGVLDDTVAAISYLRTRSDIDTNKIFIFGQGLGGTLAIAAAVLNPQGVRAVAAESAFYSYSSVVDDRRPGEGYSYEKDDAYSAGAYVSKLTIPLLLIHGERDDITYCAHSQQLLEEAKGPKELVLIKHGRHLAAMTEHYGDWYQKRVLELFENAVK